jgi:hypothetical protein
MVVVGTDDVLMVVLMLLVEDVLTVVEILLDEVVLHVVVIVVGIVVVVDVVHAITNAGISARVIARTNNAFVVFMF